MANEKQKIEKKIKDLKDILSDKGITGEERKELESALAHLEKKHAALKDEPAAPKAEKKTKADKKSVTPKHEPAKEEKKKTFRLFGTEFNLDEDNCDLGEDLRKAFAARKAASETTKKRTVPITKKIAGKIVDAIETAIKDVAAAEIKDDPKAFQKDASKLVDAGEKFADAIAEFMGNDFKDNQAATEFKELQKMINDLVAKHKTKKLEKGGEMPTHKVVDRTTGLTEFEGTYHACLSFFNKQGNGLSIFKIGDPTHDEEGNSNAILSN